MEKSVLRLLLTLLLMTAAPLLAAALPRSETVTVIGAPWADAEGMMAIVAGADGSPVRGGGLANVMLAHSPQPGFVGRLYGAGAWLVLGESVAIPCFTSTSREAP